MVLDFRSLNSISVAQASATIPNINEIFDSLYGKTIFTVMDLRDAYHSTAVFDKHRRYTAFQKVDGQILHWVALPFGLVSAPATFSILMAHVLQGTIGQFAQNYLDDILIYSNSEAKHLQHIKEILLRLAAAKLKVSVEKCVWATTEVGFLGHVISKEGLRPKPENLEKIIKLTPPTTVKGLRSVCGILSYYRKVST